jgi:hypothetical protein
MVRILSVARVLDNFLKLATKFIIMYHSPTESAVVPVKQYPLNGLSVRVVDLHSP